VHQQSGTFASPYSFRTSLSFLLPSRNTFICQYSPQGFWTMSTIEFKRTLVGPLTTNFIPPDDCVTPFEYASFGGGLELGIYGENCASERSCLPGTGTDPATYTTGGYYSPGLNCPEGWETATTIDSRIPELQSQLLPDESAALCCPR
jgi:hypothetical protein